MKGAKLGSKVDNAQVVAMLANGEPITRIAREFEISYGSAWNIAHLDETKDAVTQELKARRAIVARQRDAGATRVLKRAIEAAEGKWEPTGAQLELIRYFLGWDMPGAEAAPQAAAQAIVVNL